MYLGQLVFIMSGMQPISWPALLYVYLAYLLFYNMHSLRLYLRYT